MVAADGKTTEGVADEKRTASGYMVSGLVVTVDVIPMVKVAITIRYSPVVIPTYRLQTTEGKGVPTSWETLSIGKVTTPTCTATRLTVLERR